MKGKFIALEGPDGSGKSTLAQGLKTYYQKLNRDLVLTREPGGTPLGESIRAMLLELGDDGPDPRAEALLFAAARAQHVDRVIRPALEKGVDVLSDRFVLSSIAYQGVGRGLGRDAVAGINSFAIAEVRPDLTLFLTVNPREGLRRKHGAGALDRIEIAGNQFQERVLNAYRELSENHTDDTLVVINGDQDRETVLKEAIAAIEKLHARD